MYIFITYNLNHDNNIFTTKTKNLESVHLPSKNYVVYITVVVVQWQNIIARSRMKFSINIYLQ